MFNWKPTRESPDSSVTERQVIFENRVVAKLNDLEVKWERDRADLWKAIKDTQEAAGKPQMPPNITDLENKLVVLETWRAQLHTLLIERGNTGKPKLTKTGNALSKFYGGNR